MKSEKILIVSFFYPPSPAIGGRRWALLAKYFHKAGLDVFVIASDSGVNKGESPWSEDIVFFKQNVLYLPNKTPYHIKNKTPNGIIEKIRYKISLLFTRILRKDSVYDSTCYFADDAYQNVKNMVETYSIKNVVVTGGPFHLVYKLSQLKQLLGDKLNLMIDLRDPWTEHIVLRTERDKLERKKQDYAYKMADTIFVPVDGMKKDSDKIWNDFENKIKVLPHAFDPEIYSAKKGISDFTKWFYAGTIMHGLEEEYGMLERLVLKFSINVNFYSFNTSANYNIINTGLVTLNKVVSQKVLLSRTMDNGVALFITRFKDHKSTKFYEIIKSGTFMLYIGKKGELSAYINLNKIGYALEIDNFSNIETTFSEIRKAFDDFVPKPHLADGYSFSEVVKIVINELK